VKPCGTQAAVSVVASQANLVGNVHKQRALELDNVPMGARQAFGDSRQGKKVQSDSGRRCH
jgi:hypothetical protein